MKKLWKTIKQIDSPAKILPGFMVLVTRRSRYLPKIEWSQKSWTHNIFRIYEMIFWRQEGVRIENQTIASKENGQIKIVYKLYTLEAVMAFVETLIRNYLQSLMPKKIEIQILQYALPLQQISIPWISFAIAFDATSNGEGAAANFSVSHTCTGSNRVLVTNSFCEITTTAATYNSVAMTALVSQSLVHSFGLVAPATGANNVVLNNPANNVKMSSCSFTGADQSTGTGATQTATNTSITASLSITSTVANGFIFDIAQTTFGTLTVGGSQTQRFNGTLNSWIVATSTLPTTTVTSYTMSWTLDSSRVWNQLAVEIKPLATTSNSAMLAFF